MQQSNLRINNSYRDQSASQQLAHSHILQLQDPKNSRIINRKQIEKRLQNLKPAECEKVISNLTNQNRRLQEQVRNLNQKVEQIISSKKIQNPHHKNPLMQEEVKKAKKQLALKYQSMNYLKQELRKAKNTELTEEMRNKIRQYKNQIVNIQSQKQILAKQKIKLTGIYQSNIQHLEEYHPKQDNLGDRIKSLKQENKNLILKIRQINGSEKDTFKSSQQVLDKFYNLKMEEQKFSKVISQAKAGKKNITLTDIKGINFNQITVLEKEVQQLKKQKKDAQKQLVNEKIFKDHKKIKLQKQARQNLENHKQLLRRKMKLVNQLNMYEAKDKKQKQAIIAKQHKKIQIKKQEKGSQTDKIIPIDFRRQWLGKSQGIPFDDSQILDYRSHVYIKSLIIYKNADYIGFVKFFYENNQKKRYESKIPFDQAILRKYENKKFSAKGDAYLRSYRIYLTNDIVTKIQFIWSDNEEISEGWQSQKSVKFAADINNQQRPISMFGTLSFQGKTSYALESLGCQVNKNEQDQ